MKSNYENRISNFENRKRASFLSNLPHMTVRGLYCGCVFALIYPKGCQAVSQGNSVIPVTKLRPVPVLEGTGLNLITGITEFPWELGYSLASLRYKCSSSRALLQPYVEPSLDFQTFLQPQRLDI